MDIRKVKKLIELLEESGVTEIEVCEGEESVRISRQASPASGHTTVQMPQVMQPAYADSTQTPLPRVEETVAATPEPTEEGYIVKAPMVGIFYVASGPDEPPFVQLGKQISKGDALCVIEAMKIMNQIESDVGGEITKIHVENGDPVEYGQALFTIR